MRRLSAFGVVALAALAGVVAAPSEGWADPVPPTVGSLVGSISAPSTAHAGSTYAFSYTMRQTSSYTMLADGTLVTIWLPSNLNAYTATRNALQWRNPATGAWQSPTSVDNSTGLYVFDLGDRPSWLSIAPHGSVTYEFRLSLASSLPAGTYRLFPGDPTYELDDSAGNSVNALLDTPDYQTTFTIGGGSSTSGGTGNSGGSGSGAGGSTPKAVATKAVPSVTSARPSPRATTSSPAASPTPSASAPAVATSAPVTPTSGPTRLDLVPTAATSSHTTAMVLWPIAFVVVLGVPTALLVLRRRRGPGIAGAEVEAEAEATHGDPGHEE